MVISINSTQAKTLLLQFQQALSPASIRSELQIAGVEGVNEAKRLVKVDTGKLQSSVYSEVRGNDTVALGAREEYGPYVEYGTSKQNAKPFIEPGGLRIVTTLEQNLQRKINKQ